MAIFLIANDHLLKINKNFGEKLSLISLSSNVMANLIRHPSDRQDVVYQDLWSVVAEMLSSGHSVDDIQFICEAAFKDIITFYKQNRNTCQLLPLSSYNTKNESDQFIQEETKSDPIYSLSAMLLLKENKSLVKLAAELEACSVIHSEFNNRFDIQSTVNLYKKQVQSSLKLQSELNTELQNTQAENKNLKQEIDLSKKVTQEAQAEIQNNAQNNAKQEQEFKLEIADLTKQLSKLKSIHQDSLSENQKLVDENELIIEQLHQVQEVLETKLIQIENNEKAYQKEKESLNKERDSVKKELLHTQKSLENNLARVKELYQESTALLQQLEKVQVNFEKEKHSKKEIEKAYKNDLETLQKELKVSKDKIANLTISLKNAESENKNLSEDNELIIEQLHYVQETLEDKVLNLNFEQQNSQKLSEEIMILKRTLDNAEKYQSWLRNSLTKVNKLFFKKNRAYRNSIKAKAKLLENSDVFDAQWYLENYPDLKTSNIDLAIHYVLYGAYEGRNPDACFHTLHYLYHYEDVSQSSMLPAIHFLQFGQFEGRQANPMQKRLPSPSQLGIK